MALSPWMAKGRLEIREAAALLAGVRPDDPGLTFNEDTNDYNQWRRILVHAAFVCELESDWCVEEREDRERYTKKVTYDPWPQEVWAWVKKSSLHKWLKDQGIPDSDIPLEIRTYPEEGSLEAGCNGDELRALEALGLLAETFAKQAHKYQRNGKPNRAQIAEAMSQQAGEVYGMSKSKLQRLLSDALDAWEEKRG